MEDTIRPPVEKRERLKERVRDYARDNGLTRPRAWADLVEKGLEKEEG